MLRRRSAVSLVFSALNRPFIMYTMPRGQVAERVPPEACQILTKNLSMYADDTMADFNALIHTVYLCVKVDTVDVCLILAFSF